MKYRELLENFQTIDQVIEAYKIENKYAIEQGCTRDYCGIPAHGFSMFARDNGFPEVEYVSKGSFKVDKALYKKADFYPSELKQMKKEGFNPNKLEDRVAFAKKYDMEEGLKQIPHQWTEYKDRIIDFTAHKQFVESGLAADTNQERYSYGKHNLTESSRSAPLYHFTNGILKILKTNTLGVKTTGLNPARDMKIGDTFVSLTRDPHHMFNFMTYCLILDQSKLVQKYKFEKTFGNVVDNTRRESEERIKQAIIPLNKYLKAIVMTRLSDSVVQHDSKYIFEWAKIHNIPVYEAPRTTERLLGQFVNGWVHKMKLINIDTMLKS